MQIVVDALFTMVADFKAWQIQVDESSLAIGNVSSFMLHVVISFK